MPSVFDRQFTAASLGSVRRHGATVSKMRAVPVYGECVGQAKQRVVSHMLSRLFSTQRALFARAPLSLLHFERDASGRCACYQP